MNLQMKIPQQIVIVIPLVNGKNPYEIIPRNKFNFNFVKYFYELKLQLL